MIGALREVHIQTHVNIVVLKSSALLIPKQTKLWLGHNLYCVRTPTFYTILHNYPKFQSSVRLVEALLG